MNNKRVLLTGATGLIGKEAIEPLQNSGFEVFAPGLEEFNLFNELSVNSFLENVKPEYLLHFAWFTGEGYLESELNYDFLNSSVNLLEKFIKNGGKRAVFSGTCFEYDFCDKPIKETQSLNPKSIYAQCKNELRVNAEKIAEKYDISFAWGRIFYVYGKNEAENRLGGALATKLAKNEVVTINSAQLQRDYVYSKDIARAFVAILNSDIRGSINISKNNGMTLEDFALEYAKQLGKENYLNIKYENSTQSLKIIGDNARLTKELGFKFKYNHTQAVAEILSK